MLGVMCSAIFALIAWMVALITDLLDAPIARRRGTVTAFSGTFDHTSDFLFVTSGLFAGALRGAFPWILLATRLSRAARDDPSSNKRSF